MTTNRDKHERDRLLETVKRLIGIQARPSGVQEYMDEMYAEMRQALFVVAECESRSH